jgi:hypothetical protein
MRRVKRTWLRNASLVAGGVTFQLGACSPEGLVNLVTGLNPCNSILNCDPQAFAFIASDIDGPGFYEEDPFCSFPPFCTTAQDPIFGGLAP